MAREVREMHFNDSFKSRLRAFFEMKAKDGTKVRAGKDYVYRMLDFRFSSGEERARHDRSLEHLYKQIEDHVSHQQLVDLAGMFQELMFDQYEKAEIKQAFKELEKELKEDPTKTKAGRLEPARG